MTSSLAMVCLLPFIGFLAFAPTLYAASQNYCMIIILHFTFLSLIIRDIESNQLANHATNSLKWHIGILNGHENKNV